MGGRLRTTCLAAAIALLWPGAALAQDATTDLPPPAEVARDITSVLAVIDSGINPYHATYRDDSPRAYVHPSRYIEGFPKDAKPLRLTLDEPDYLKAVARDCERVWAKAKPGELYWFPGTKIVGAIAIGETSGAGQVNCNDTSPGQSWMDGIPILDRNGHGTMTSSRAVSTEYGACRECLLVAVQSAQIDAIRWAAKNSSWIDAQSNSWGPLAPLWAPIPTLQPPLFNYPEFVRGAEWSARRHPMFWATGNGVLTRAGVLGHPTVLDPRVTPSVLSVGAHDSGYVTTWHGFPPLLVSDGCYSWAADHQHTERSSGDIGSGTSASTPFVAGGAARILLEARRLLNDRGNGIDPKGQVVASGDPGSVSEGPLADGELTLEEWRRLVLATATERPKPQFEDAAPCDVNGGLVIYGPTSVRWEDVPEEFPEYLNIGYGAVDRPALRLAFAVMRGEKPLPDRSDTDAYFEADAQARAALYEVFSRP